MHRDYNVSNHSLPKPSLQVSVGLSPAMHVSALFCSINTLLVYFLGYDPKQ
jgi:hypothetical protein